MTHVRFCFRFLSLSCFLCVDLVIFDMPYGIYNPDEVPWDRPLSDVELKELMRQLGAANAKDDVFVVFFCSPFQMGKIKDVLEEFGYKSIMPLFWYKPGCNKPGLFRYIPAVETAIVAYKGSRKEAHSGMKQAPEERQNLFNYQPVSSPFRYPIGQILNPAEKPVELMTHIIQSHCPTGGLVLSLGFGSGTDIIAALGCGVNVIGVERDDVQFTGGIERIRKWLVDQETGTTSPSKLTRRPGRSEAADDDDRASEGKTDDVLSQFLSEEISEPALPTKCIVCSHGADMGPLIPCPGCLAIYHSKNAFCRYECKSCFTKNGIYYCSKMCHNENATDNHAGLQVCILLVSLLNRVFVTLSRLFATLFGVTCVCVGRSRACGCS
jgi:DNA modification methylase